MASRALFVLVAALGLVAASACTVEPGDGSKCSQDPCSFCTGKSPTVYADPGALGKTFFDCFAPSGAECLACTGYTQGAECPAPASPSPVPTPASPAPVVAAVVTTPASPAVNQSPAPTPGCALSPGDGSVCSTNPCGYCTGKTIGLYPDPANNNQTYFLCYGVGAECLKCWGTNFNEHNYQCPGSTAPLPASPSPVAAAVPATPAATTSPAPSCQVTPGDGSTCSQNPCSWCTGKADGVYSDPAQAGKTYFDCFTSSTTRPGAECLACSAGESDAQCPGAAATAATAGRKLLL